MAKQKKRSKKLISQKAKKALRKKVPKRKLPPKNPVAQKKRLTKKYTPKVDK